MKSIILTGTPYEEIINISRSNVPSTEPIADDTTAKVPLYLLASVLVDYQTGKVVVKHERQERGFHQILEIEKMRYGYKPSTFPVDTIVCHTDAMYPLAIANGSYAYDHKQDIVRFFVVRKVTISPNNIKETNLIRKTITVTGSVTVKDEYIIIDEDEEIAAVPLKTLVLTANAVRARYKERE